MAGFLGAFFEFRCQQIGIAVFCRGSGNDQYVFHSMASCCYSKGQLKLNVIKLRYCTNEDEKLSTKLMAESFFLQIMKKRLDKKMNGFLHNPKEIVEGKIDYDFRELLLFTINDPRLS